MPGHMENLTILDQGALHYLLWCWHIQIWYILDRFCIFELLTLKNWSTLKSRRFQQPSSLKRLPEKPLICTTLYTVLIDFISEEQHYLLGTLNICALAHSQAGEPLVHALWKSYEALFLFMTMHIFPKTIEIFSCDSFQYFSYILLKFHFTYWPTHVCCSSTWNTESTCHMIWWSPCLSPEYGEWAFLLSF